MKVKEPVSQKEWDAYYTCRWETLRAPWGQPRGSEKVDDDDQSFHIMVIENDEVCGVARMHMTETAVWQIRFMGVREKFRRKGIGKILLDYYEERIIAEGGGEMVLHARESAIPFYQRCGYAIEEKSHLMWGEIQHYKMKKKIS